MKKPVPVSVRKSAIHGRGLFAEAPVAAGARVIEYTGQKIDDAEGRRRDAYYNSIGYTLLIRASTRYIDALIGGNESIYINHSTSPNAEAIGARGRVWIEALRDIAAGEEITFDYGFDPVEMARKAGLANAPGDDAEDRRHGNRGVKTSPFETAASQPPQGEVFRDTSSSPHAEERRRRVSKHEGGPRISAAGPPKPAPRR